MATVRDMKAKRKVVYTNAKETAHKQQSGFSPACLNLPKGVSLFSFKKEGQYQLDVMPFIAGKGNPMADEGFVHWERTFWAHKGVGAENKQYCCLEKNWGKACPICEHRREQEKKGASEDYVKSLWPKKRQLMAVIDLEDKNKKVQIFEGTYNLGLGEWIDKKINNAREGSKVGNFFHLEDGMTLCVTVKSATFPTKDGGGGKWMKVDLLDIEPREHTYEDDILETIPCLDDILDKPDYEKLKTLFHKGTDEVEEEEKDEDPKNVVTASKPIPVSPPVVEKNGDTEVEVEFELGDKVKHLKYGVCSVLAISDGKLKIQDAEKNVHRAIKPSEVILYEEPEEDEDDDNNDNDDDEVLLPAVKAVAKVSSKIDDDDDDDDDNDDDDDDDD